jgi:eukaryotic-like serine/threonine-protein kinase
MAENLGKLDRYALLEEIGAGGFGTVYKAHDPALDRNVALKILRPHLTNDPTTLERFRQEAKQAARLKHPNIVTVYEVAEFEGRYYIVMEFIKGQPLSQILEDEDSLPPKRATEIIRQIGEALDYAHSENLIHRDVKPSNILIAEDSTATLSDFGIVKAMDEGGLTTTGVSLGTPEYMAPEQITGREIDNRTDLYALSVVGYHMFTGRPPFVGATRFVIQKGHAEKSPPDPREINTELGEYIFKALIHWTFDKIRGTASK